MQIKWFDDLQEGESVEVIKTITEEDSAMYMAATGDFGPVHVDAEYARDTHFGERIAPGIMIGAIATSVLTSQLLGPLGVSIEDTFRFKGPVRYEDTVSIVVRIIRKIAESRTVEWGAIGKNQNGEIVLEVSGFARFPRRK